MAASRISSFKSGEKFKGTRTALASAVLEWLLICLLFLDAIFSYLITKFASYCQLQSPCLLCSRLDHILGNKKLKHYWDLICRHHKLEISSIVLCHAHNNLVDVQGMCENCLFSFATVNKSNAETYRLLVGKLGEDSSYGLDQDPLLENHISSIRRCSCCNEPWIQKARGEKLMQMKSIGSITADIDIPLSRDLGNDWEGQMQSKHYLSIGTTHQRNSEFDSLPHVGYTELKINSDTESEALLSDDDDANVPIHKINAKEDATVRDIHLEAQNIILADDFIPEKLIDSVSVPKPSVLVSLLESDIIKSNGVTSVASGVAIGHGLEELNWQQVECKPDLSTGGGFVSAEEVPPLLIARETPGEVSKDSNLITIEEFPPQSDPKETSVEPSKESEVISTEDLCPLTNDSGIPVEISKESRLISLIDVLPSSNAAETPIEGLKNNSAVRPVEIWRTLVPESEEMCKPEKMPATITKTTSEINSVSGEIGVQVPNSLDLGEAYKLAVGNKGRQLSGLLSEQWIGKDSSRLSEDLKVLLSQLSVAREQSMSDASPRVPMSPKIPASPKLSINSDELKTSDTSSIIGMQILQKRRSLERNESGQSLDGSIVSEIEGESMVDRLKRQIEHDKRLLSALYKELEEERSASAIAANQAMAMITRLQEEKATLQMEALQCLRMMEEQAEYDMEALQKTNDLLAEKEKEVQDLEAELEFYKDKFPNESTLEAMVSPVCDIRGDPSEAGSFKEGINIQRNFVTIVEKPNGCNEVDGTNVS